MDNKYHVRWMIRRDFKEVLAAALNGMTGWDEKELILWTRQRDVIGLVSEVLKTGKVTGAILYRLGEEELDIVDIVYLCADAGGEQAMIDTLVLKVAIHRQRRFLTFTVAEHDLDRQIFLRGYGFRARAQTSEDLQSGQYHFTLEVDKPEMPAEVLQEIEE